MPHLPLVSVLVSFMLFAGFASAAQFQVEQDKDSVTVKVDGQLFTRYLVQSGHKPILWPLLGPTGKEITRAYPMQTDKPEEKQDHPHHRSLWFTHGDVNGVDFWAETAKSGRIVHREFVKVAGGEQAVIATRSDWIAPDGKKQCEDETVYTFGADGGSRWIDVDITVRASNGSLKFGDTKEGSFGVRVAETMKVTAKQGGRIVTSEGLTDAAAWGKPAKWVDYHGPVGGETLGLAMLNHPTSFRHPTTWHVRDYGLFASNPFGLKGFAGPNAEDDAFTVQPGTTLLLRHRVLLHKGDEKQGKVAEAYAAYAELKK